MKVKQLHFVFLTAILTLFSAQIFGQTYQLLAQNSSNGKIKHLAVKDKIFLKQKGDVHAKEGLLTAVNENSLELDGKQILLDEILFIGKKMRGRTLLILIGLPIVIGGFAWAGIGSLFFLNGVFGAGALWILGGIGDISLGGTIAAIGLTPILLRGRKFDLEKQKWTLKTVALTD